MENLKPGDLQKAIREALPKFHQDYDKILRDAYEEWNQYFTERVDLKYRPGTANEAIKKHLNLDHIGRD